MGVTHWSRRPSVGWSTSSNRPDGARSARRRTRRRPVVRRGRDLRLAVSRSNHTAVVSVARCSATRRRARRACSVRVVQRRVARLVGQLGSTDHGEEARPVAVGVDERRRGDRPRSGTGGGWVTTSADSAPRRAAGRTRGPRGAPPVRTTPCSSAIGTSIAAPVAVDARACAARPRSRTQRPSRRPCRRPRAPRTSVSPCIHDCAPAMPGDRLHDVVVRGKIGVRAVGAEADDRTVHERRD